MSATKRWLDDEIEKLAIKHNEDWNDVMDLAFMFDFNLELVDRLLAKAAAVEKEVPNVN